MPIRNLDQIFHPQSIAVVGASSQTASVGMTVLRNLMAGGFKGEIYPVNPKYESIENRSCYSNVGALPNGADLAVICTPANTVPGIVRECGEANISGLVILSAGFRETGKEGEKLEAQIRDVARDYGGMRIIGPNCLGVMSPHGELNATFAAGMSPQGNVAFISQSGALCTAVLDWALQEDIGFSQFVSVGNMMDVGIADLIDYFALDQWTDSIILYVESITEARQFMSAARAFAKNKPIIAYKAGRFAESAKAAASHTGALAGVDAVYDAAFARAGIVRVFEVKDLFDCAELLARKKTPRGARLAIVSNAGGPGVMATDALLERHGVLAALTEQTLDVLNSELPAAWSRGNPVDLLGDAPPDRFGKAVDAVFADEKVDGVLTILTPQAMTDPTGVAQAVIAASHKSQKPMLTAWMGGESVREGINLFNREGIPTYDSPEQGVHAFMYLVSYARNRQLLYETPREVPLEFPLNRSKLREVFDTNLAEGHNVLSESASKALLEAYEIPVAKTIVAHTADDAAELAGQVGFPVVLKVFSPQITHKTDVRGVELNLPNAEEVHASFERIVSRAKERCPDAVVEGVTVQKMISVPNGHELIVGAKRDPVFGVVLLVGNGGIGAELYRDHALELPPLNERLARRALESLQSWPLLRGYRGRPGVNVDRLVEVLIRFSYLVAEFPEIAELDVNPLLATPEDVIALDARIILDPDAVLHPARPYSHLAIRPYPEEFTKRVKLPDDTQVLLRTIRPEDEPMWHELLESCSPESIRFRFRGSFKSTTHEMATRFCFIDYDREIAIVAEVEESNQRKLTGVGRLVADADHGEAEFAILVGDPWHGKGLGSLLTDYCLEVCQRWGVRRVVAETSPDNHRMLNVFRDRGFTIVKSQGHESVMVSLDL